MALTQEQKDLILNTIAGKFNGDLQLFESWLKRSKLESELAAIESQIRNTQEAQSADIDQYNAQIEKLQQDKQAKLAEIDNL